MAASDDCVPNTLPVNGISFHTVCLAAAQVPTADRRPPTHTFKICFTGPLYRRVGDSHNHAVAAPHPHHHNKQSEISETRPALSSSTDRITIPVSNKLKLKTQAQAQSSMYLFSFSLICGNCRIDRTGGAPQNNKEFFFFFLNMGGSFSLADYLLMGGY